MALRRRGSMVPSPPATEETGAMGREIEPCQGIDLKKLFWLEYVSLYVCTMLNARFGHATKIIILITLIWLRLPSLKSSCSDRSTCLFSALSMPKKTDKLKCFTPPRQPTHGLAQALSR
jgi:hypothetical protein